MPAISLVVCLCQERDYLRRLLQASGDCYDDLVVVHDGPDNAGVRTVVESAGGRFFEGKREYQQEPHWPFAWGQAKCDWILRLDADEFPGERMKQWLKKFRRAPEPPAEISGYTCIWPIWNGQHAISKHWPAGRHFLFNKRSVRFFGMAEQVPEADGHYEALDLVLHHEPVARQSHSLRNILLRKRASQWRQRIAVSLLGKPTDLVCWRWTDDTWPPGWEQIRHRPLQTAIRRLVMSTWRTLRDQWRTERRIFPIVAISGPVNHALICLAYRRLRRTQGHSDSNQTSVH